MAQGLVGLLGGLLLVLAGDLKAVTITDVGFTWSPAALTVTAGTQVDWVWGGFHDVNSDTSLFLSGAPQSPGSFSFTFNSPGTFGYHCRVHGGAGTGMFGIVYVVPAPTATDTVTPTLTATPSITETHTETPVASPTETGTETPVFTPTITPTVTLTPTPTLTWTSSPVLSPTFTLTASPTPLPLSLAFAGGEQMGFLASPIVGRRLKLWARLSGGAEGGELRVHSGSFTRLATFPLGPLPPGQSHLAVDLPAFAAQAIWVQLHVQSQGRWRRGPVIRSYVLP